MDVVISDELGRTKVHEVSEATTAAQWLHEVCTLFGREELDSALEVDGAVVCTGVVGGVSGGEASVGSLGVHAASSVVLRRSRERVLAVVAEWEEASDLGYNLVTPGGLPEWAWDDGAVALAVVAFEDFAVTYASARLQGSDAFLRGAVARHACALRFASDELRGEKQLVMAAVAQYGDALAYASADLREDKEVVLAAVAQGRIPLAQIPEHLRADGDIVRAAATRR